jgi:hypothetical protein
VTDLAGRYGTRGRPRWLWPLLAVVGIGIGITWAAWAAFQPHAVTATLYGYKVVNAHHVTVTLDVRRHDPALAVRCTAYAQAKDHETVGEKTVDVPPGERESTRITISLETERRAVTGLLRTCESAD